MNVYDLEYEKSVLINLRGDIINICNDIENTYDTYDKIIMNLRSSFIIDEECADLSKIINNKNSVVDMKEYLSNVILNEIDLKIGMLNSSIANCNILL